MKIGKIVMCALLSLMVFSLVASVASAHAPSGMELAYDGDSSILTVTMNHSVGDPKSHYIEKCSVDVDGEEVYELEAEKQFDKGKGEFVFYLPGLSSGAEIEVEAYCSKVGKTTGKLVVK